MPGLLDTRLRHQRLIDSTYRTPQDVVAWLGAVQAQEYGFASWALALRSTGVTQTDVNAALASGAILRTHVLRPTWHFVTPGDLRWMLALTGPRIARAMASYDKSLELDARIYTRATKRIVRTLEGGHQRTRKELATALAATGITAAGQRLAHLVMRAELDGVICSGGLQGKQFTYRLIDEHVPPARALSRDEALAALATRYFRSHGPATIRDFSWWSGLTLADSRAAVALADVGAALLASPPGLERARGHHLLLPIYDEYLIAYRDRDAVLDPKHARNLGIKTADEFPHQVVVDGRVGGSWQRSVDARSATIELQLHAPAARAQTTALRRAAARYGDFLGLPCTMRH